MSDVAIDLKARYLVAMRSFLEGGGEPALREAYELGRQALAQGQGVSELAMLHMETLADVLEAQHATGRCDGAVRRLGLFVAEGLASYEMTHRGFYEANRELRRLNVRLSQRMEDETKRIAHLLHDEIGQDLVTVLMALDEEARSAGDGSRDRLGRIRELLSQMEHRLRALSHELRPTVLDDLGLGPAVEQLARRVSKAGGPSVELEDAPSGRLPLAVEVALYRIVQEALNNVVRHARARRVTIRLTREGRRARCSVRDDGVGFEPGKPSGPEGTRGLGLVGLRERAEALGGTLEVKSAIGSGTEIVAIVPLEEAGADPSAAG